MLGLHLTVYIAMDYIQYCFWATSIHSSLAMAKIQYRIWDTTPTSQDRPGLPTRPYLRHTLKIFGTAESLFAIFGTAESLFVPCTGDIYKFVSL